MHTSSGTSSRRSGVTVPVTASRGRSPLISGLHDRSAQTSRSRFAFAPCTLSGDHSQDRSWVRPGQPPQARQQNALSCASLDTERHQHASSIPAQRLSGPASVDLVHAGPSSTAVCPDGHTLSGNSNGAQPQAPKAGGDSRHRSAPRQPASTPAQPTMQRRPDGQHSVHSAAAAAAASVAEHSSLPHSAPAAAELRCGTTSEVQPGPSSQAEDEQPSESGFMPSDGLAAMHSDAADPPPPPSDARPRWLRRHGGRDAPGGEALEDQPTESGVLPEERLTAVRPAEAALSPGHMLFPSSWRRSVELRRCDQTALF